MPDWPVNLYFPQRDGIREVAGSPAPVRDDER